MNLSRVTFLSLFHRTSISHYRRTISSRLFKNCDNTRNMTTLTRAEQVAEIQKRCNVEQVGDQDALRQQQQSAWNSLWIDNIVPWDLGQPTPALITELTKSYEILPPNKSTVRVLIPGAGAGYDLITIANHFDKLVEKHLAKFDKNDGTISKKVVVMGLDLSKQPLLRSKEIIEKEFQEKSSLRHTQVNLVVGDFFEAKRTTVFSLHGNANDPGDYDETFTYDFIFDYTFFCAIPPVLRENWGRRMSELLAPSGRLLTFMFPIVPDLDEGTPLRGPPYPVTVKDYRNVLEPNGIVMDQSGPRRSDEVAEHRVGLELMCWWEKV